MRPGYIRLVVKKIFRDLREGWLSFGACFLMVALSVSLFLAFFTAAHSLEKSTESTYEKLNFLHFTLWVNNVSEAEVSRVLGVPGVSAAAGRLTRGVEILLDPFPTPSSRSRRLAGRIIGLPLAHRPYVNDVFVEQGRYLGLDRGEALLERRFAQHNGYRVGDTLRLSVDGDERRFRLVGLVSSPEYIWMVTDRFDPRPMEKRFGVVFVSEADARSVSGGGFINEIHVRVERPDQMAEVIARVEKVMERSLKAATQVREDQPSHALVLRDRAAFQGLAVFFPAIFLSLSSITLFSTMWQLMSRQRRQIGILMSQGCSSKQLLFQYLLLGLVVGVLGALLGAAIGVPLGSVCTNFYTGILGLPFVEIRTPLSSAVAISLGSVLLALMAAWMATRRILVLDPIAALRMEFQEGWGSRHETLIDSFLPTRVRFALRNLTRNPGRSLLSVLGIAVSVAQIVMTLALFDSQNSTMKYYFRTVHQYDFEVSLRRVFGTSSLPHVGSWPEVESVERCLRQPALIKAGGRQLQTMLWGLEQKGELLRLYDRRGQSVTLTREPLLFMGPVQQARLGVGPGDIVTIALHRNQPDPPEFRYSVASTLHEPLANPPKLEISQLQSMAGKTGHYPLGGVNVLLVKAKPGQSEALARRLLAEDSVNHIFSPLEMKGEVDDLLRMFNAYKTLILAFTAIFGLVVLLGTTTMNVVERTREFATLSCLGVSDAKIAGLLFLETLFLWLAGFLLGLPAGLALGMKIMNSFQSQLLQLDLFLSWGTAAATGAISLSICLLALLYGLLRLRSLPLTAATQERFD